MTYDLDKCVENSMNTIKVYYSSGERIVRRFVRAHLQEPKVIISYEKKINS